MSQAQREPMTPHEFVAWEAAQEQTWEFDGFEPVATTGASYRHSRLHGRLITQLNNRLDGTRCQPLGPKMRVPVPGGSYRYPDALVTRSPISDDARDVEEPVVLFEVLSPSTENTDRGTKLREYLSLPSLRRYVMLEQDKALATVLSRTGSGWMFELVDADGVLAMPEIGIGVSMADLYQDLPPPGSG